MINLFASAPLQTQNTQKHTTQLLFKSRGKNSFSFQFSARTEDLYIGSIDQSIDYGWETPSDEIKSVLQSPVTQVAFNSNKTAHSLTFNGIIYINSGLGTGVENFTKFKNECATGAHWDIIYNQNNQTQTKLQGIWYVKNISQNASNFTNGIEALKMEFTITVNKYQQD
ncbi:hypothetical protein ABSA28_01136 [Candidatus Hepatincolaceae symbiont of Richtersius coronifer]